MFMQTYFQNAVSGPSFSPSFPPLSRACLLHSWEGQASGALGDAPPWPPEAADSQGNPGLTRRA